MTDGHRPGVRPVYIVWFIYIVGFKLTLGVTFVNITPLNSFILDIFFKNPLLDHIVSLYPTS